jgi:hypothetical protein
LVTVPWIWIGLFSSYDAAKAWWADADAATSRKAEAARAAANLFVM